MRQKEVKTGPTEATRERKRDEKDKRQVEDWVEIQKTNRKWVNLTDVLRVDVALQQVWGSGVPAGLYWAAPSGQK